jgi:hypothetical protein
VKDVNYLMAKWERIEKEKEEFNKQFLSNETIVKVVVSKDLEVTLDLIMSDIQKFDTYHFNPYEPDKYVVPEETFGHIVDYLNSISKPVQIENDGYFTKSLFCIKYKGVMYEYEMICGQGTEDWIKLSDREVDKYIELVVE